MLHTCLIDPPLPLFPPPDLILGGSSPSCPDNPTPNVYPHRIIRPPGCHLSLSQHTAYRLQPRPHYSLFMLYPSEPPCSCHTCPILVTAKIASTVTLIWSYYALCLHHSTRSLPLPSYTVSRAHTSKIGQVATHSATASCRLATYVLIVCVPAT